MLGLQGIGTVLTVMETYNCFMHKTLKMKQMTVLTGTSILCGNSQKIPF